MIKKLMSAASAVLFFGALAAPSFAEQVKTVPVMLYPDTDHGTCSIGLQVNAGGAVMRSGPSKKFPIVAKFEAGHVISGCDEKDGWDGIIDGAYGTCSIGISVTAKRPYTGSCNSGWIDTNFLTSIYG